jgi:hypothetical protein
MEFIPVEIFPAKSISTKSFPVDSNTSELIFADICFGKASLANRVRLENATEGAVTGGLSEPAGEGRSPVRSFHCT